MAGQVARQRHHLGERKEEAPDRHLPQRGPGRKLRALVDEAGNRMPSANVLEAYWLLWVLADQATSAKPAVVQRITVSDLCWLYLRALAASPQLPSERTMQDYKQYVRDHVDTHWFGKVDA